VEGAASEGLLEKAASEAKKGAGRYFTPRPLIQSICRVMKPDPRGKPEFEIRDPTCGTGGFLVCAYAWLVAEAKDALIQQTHLAFTFLPYHSRSNFSRSVRVWLGLASSLSGPCSTLQPFHSRKA